MRLLVLFCLLGVTFGAPRSKEVHSDGRILSNALNELLERFRITMKEGNEEKGIPILDPLDMKTFSFDFEAGNKFSFSVTAGDIHVTGLSDFEVLTVDLSMAPLGLTYEINLPMSIVKSETYNFKGLVFGALPIYGNGKSYFEIGNLKFSGFATMGNNPNGVFIKDMNLHIALGTLKSETTGMLGGGDIDNVINALLADLAADFFNSYSDLIADQVNDYFVMQANKVLDGVSLGDLVDLINGSKP